MFLPPQPGRLLARQNEDKDKKTDGGGGGKNNIFIIVAACLVFVLAFMLMMYFALRALRRMNCRPKYIPGKYLKDKWNRWPVGIAYGQVPGGTSNAHEESRTGNSAAGGGSEMNTNSNVRRDTSVRSVITLPAYSSSPKPEEQIIAREGERGGMDVVMEFPETAEEEENRREELMESLYQVRQQRRQEIADREARRQERRDARARGDYIRLEQLRLQSRARAESRSSANGANGANGSNTNLAAALSAAEHQSRGRDRRISSVSYAELGQVRHDGSRVRARSPDSDRHPLLSNAASINTDGPDRSSGSILTSVHSRGESYSSMQSDFSETDTLTRPESHAHSTHAAAQDGDVGGLSIPPPDYEHLDWGDAPPYESPVLDRGEQPPRLRELTPLPTIHIDAASPVNNTPTTPINHQSIDQNYPPENPSTNQQTHST